MYSSETINLTVFVTMPVYVFKLYHSFESSQCLLCIVILDRSILFGRLKWFAREDSSWDTLIALIGRHDYFQDSCFVVNIKARFASGIILKLKTYKFVRNVSWVKDIVKTCNFG